MTPKLLAALLAAAVLPVAAQTADTRITTQGTRPIAQDARTQPPKADAAVTPKERARLAKSKNKQNRKVAKQKQDTQKRPPAG